MLLFKISQVHNHDTIQVMNKIRVGLTLVFFLIFLPLLVTLGQNYGFLNSNNFIWMPKIPSGLIVEKILYILIGLAIVIYTPMLFIIGKLEEVLKYQFSAVTFIFTVMTTLVYCYLLSSIILFLFNKGKLLLKKHFNKKY